MKTSSKNQIRRVLKLESFTFKRHYLFYVSAIYLLWAAIGDFDYDYAFYQLLRFIAFFAFGFAAFTAHTKKQQIMPFILGFLAIVFNPFLPIYLERNTWQLVDVLSGVLLIMWTVATFNRGFALKLSETFQIIKKDPKGFFKDFTGLIFYIICLLILVIGLLKIIFDVIKDVLL